MYLKKITLVEQRKTPDIDGNIDDATANNDVKIAEIFNRFFSNAVNELKIPGFHGVVPLAPIFRVILNYANRPGTIVIKDLNNSSMFSFSNISGADVKRN